PALAADCDSCAALCCIALAFDEGEDFAFDKPAGLPCPKLVGHACSIYERLSDEGFPGCARYDCEGAGQRTVALYGGVSWQDETELTGPMLETFRHMRVIHELIGLLETTGQLPLEDDEAERREDLLIALCPDEMTPETAEALASGPLPGEARAFLRGLAHHL
ncbi:hypothetical protein P1J78_11875, partial [Psychromarinibacter sp. C21-152]